MALNIQKSISYPQQDAAVWKKTALGVLLAGPGSLLLVPPLLAWGYVVKVLKAALEGKDDGELPEWTNWGDLLVGGLCAFLISLLYCLPACIMGAVALIPQLGVRGKGLSMASLVGMPLVLAAFVLFVLGSILLPMALARYASSNSLVAAFNLKELFGQIKRSMSDYTLLTIGLVAGEVAIFTIGKVMGFIPILGYFAPLVMVGLWFYGMLIMCHWSGRLYRAYFLNVDSPKSVHNPLAPAASSGKRTGDGAFRRLRDDGEVDLEQE